MFSVRTLLCAACCLLLLAGPAQAVQVTFVLQAEQAGQVFLAGEFNGWSDSADALQAEDGTWSLTLDMEPGSYQYKYVVDGTWTQDTANPLSADDGFGGKNSLVEVPTGVDSYQVELGAAAPEAPAPAPVAPAGTGQDCLVRFRCEAPGAASVHLAGDFNGWSDAADPMDEQDEQDGVWTLSVLLAPGEYLYKFVVDGQWQQDAANPEGSDDGFGGKNSVLHVAAGKDEIDAAATGKGDATPAAPAAAEADDDGSMRSVEFTYTPVISGVTDVFLAGSFNDWNDSKTRMTDGDGDGTYAVTLLLPQGSYQYKFVVDGNWQQDPQNPEGSEDGFGGQNSVLHVGDNFSSIQIELGDGVIYGDDLEPVFDYSTCNPLSPTTVALTAKAHLGDVEELVLEYTLNSGPAQTAPMRGLEKDSSFQYYRTTVTLGAAADRLEYVVRYRDAQTVEYLGPRGMSAERPATGFVYTAEAFPPFFTPEWAKDGVIYQIFPDRFANGDKGNDPDFSEPWYEGVHTLPASGHTNGEYFHLVEDWYDIAGLVRSPYRTDGKPDYYSFYGGDIAGIRAKLDYLNDLGITVIYFNPLNQGMSNHKYDPVDYLKIDPHFAAQGEFQEFVQDCHARGIRIVVDMAFNHTGNWHFAFRDAVEKGPDSPYYSWYEFRRWPLPPGRDLVNASDYYDCWWGFGLHPNLNFDLKLGNAAENNIDDVADATPNMAVVDYVLSVADYWLGELDIDGFRLDVPNEVPHWFWKLWNERCKSIKPDCWLVGELWGNAGRWIGPHGFDSTMNYKFFRDPVMDFIGKGSIDAAAFEQRLGPGRFQYPPQSVAVMMNLIDSHDTIRFLTSTGDVRRLMLAAMFSMTYAGMPHIWYGDEIGMTGGKDPDCRRPFDWRYEGDPRRAALRDYYGRITRMRRDTPVLRRGEYLPLLTAGKATVYARVLDDRLALVVLNAGPTAVTLDLPVEVLRQAAPSASLRLTVELGPDVFPRAAGGSLKSGDTIDAGQPGAGTITVPAMSGAVLLN